MEMHANQTTRSLEGQGLSTKKLKYSKNTMRLRQFVTSSCIRLIVRDIKASQVPRIVSTVLSKLERT